MKRPCATPYCRNKARHQRRFCPTCRTRKWRKDNPVKAAFQALRANAKRRGKVFRLTFNDFEKFCYETAYLRGRGKTSVSFSVDRIDQSKGYVPGNLQVLTVGENSRKRTKKLVYDWEHPDYTYVVS